MTKERLDVLLVARGFFPSREKATEAIKTGFVYAGNKPVLKSSLKVDTNIAIEIKSGSQPYVSKGGLKLKKGIDAFSIDFVDKIILDVGCSTGGFSDCALQHGALFVYGVDVGSNQLDKSLFCSKLKSIENLHVKDLQLEHLDGKKMDGILVDVSFISSTQTFPYILPFLKPDGFLFTLIKPQFELDNAALDRHGIVRNTKHQITAIQRVLSTAKEMKLHLQNIDYAPLMAYKKNIEYIALFRLIENGFSENLSKLVNQAVEEKRKMKQNTPLQTLFET
ncbi:MAG: TlyA family RNA methyltransferase [Bacteroidales bacterium]|nr:TlyA family RNA methyltransferase [Bacteroidales bacterium]